MAEVLLKFEDNWADEMDVSAFVVIDADYWASVKESLAKHTEMIEVSFGSNQSKEYRNGKALLNRVTEQVLTDVETDVLGRLFRPMYGEAGFGKFPYQLLETSE